MMQIIFWICLGLIFYTYCGYPLCLFILKALRLRPVKRKEIYPSVSIIISAYNEEGVVEQRIRNLLELSYPKDKLEILIGSDGSTDATNTIVERFILQGIRFYKWEQRRGKINVLNVLVSRAQGAIIVFADARQRFDKDTVKRLVENFSDEKVGAVSGELYLCDEKESGVKKGLGLYWNYEKLLRKWESNINSTIGTTGSIYAIRKNLYSAPPADTILDDVYIPLKIVEQGYRVIFEPQAKAYDAMSESLQKESLRKVRTLAGNWQLFVMFKQMFNPFKSTLAFQFFSHKLLRVLMPYFLMSLFISNLFLLDKPLYRYIGILQMIFYVSALLGFYLSQRKISTIFAVPYSFCALNFAAIKGFFAFISKRYTVTWAK